MEASQGKHWPFVVLREYPGKPIWIPCPPIIPLEVEERRELKNEKKDSKHRDFIPTMYRSYRVIFYENLAAAFLSTLTANTLDYGKRFPYPLGFQPEFNER
jgi:hypothetical protein